MTSSRILSVLGPDQLAPFTAVRIPGQVMWCNFDLARESGFDVPRSNRLSADLEKELLDAFSFRALLHGEDPAGRPTITLFADRYGGDGVRPALGSARGGFFPYCDAFAKGIGFTPLFRYSRDFVHSHGGLYMDEAIHEALWGEVNVNLLSGRSTRALVLIDQGDDIVRPNGAITPRALAIRVCDQLRPGHVLAQRCWKRQSRLDVFLASTRETGQLVLQTDPDGQPDVRATMLRIVEDHAWMAARQVRWRITHWYLSASNMRMDGGMLDHNTLRANPRLPPIRPDRSFDPERAFYRDYVDRTLRLETLYRTLRSSMTDEERRRLNALPVEIGKAMDGAYLARLEHELLCAAGMKSGMASRIRQERLDTARRFAGVLIEMTGITNRSHLKADRRSISDVSVLDVYNLLAVYPQAFFRDPSGNHAAFAWTALSPHFKGNRSHAAKKREAACSLAGDFVEAYRELMSACREFADEFYGSGENMELSIQARAAFENRPIDPLFLMTLWKKAGAVPNTRSMCGLAAEYRATKDPHLIGKEINELVADTIRNTEELLRRRDCRPLSGGGLESQIVTIDGIRYAVRGGFLHVSFPPECFPGFARDAVERLRFGYTTDGWKTEDEAPAGLEPDGDGGLRVAFTDIRTSAPVGRLQGYLHLMGGGMDERQAVSSYAFAIPDAIDIERLSATHEKPLP